LEVANPKAGINPAPEERYRSSLIIEQKIIPKMALKLNLVEISVDLYESFIKQPYPPMPIFNLFILR